MTSTHLPSTFQFAENNVHGEYIEYQRDRPHLREIVHLGLGCNVGLSVLPLTELNVSQMQNTADDVQQLLKSQT